MIVTKLVFLRKSMELITNKHLLPFPIRPQFKLLLPLLLSVNVKFTKLMSKIPFSMVISMKKFICNYLLDYLYLLTKFVKFTVVFIVLNKCHDIGLRDLHYYT